MEHPAGKYRSALLGLRIVQVIITFINALLMVLATVLISREIDYVQRAPELAHVRNDPNVKAAVGAGIGTMIFGLVIAFVCFITCTLWLVYTAKPSARARSCGGNKPACMRYSCDMGWDIFWSVLWGVSLVLSVVQRSPSPGIKIGNIISSLIMLGLFIATAVISGKVRRNILADRLCTTNKDIQVPGGAVKPIVGAPTVPTIRV